VVRRQQIRVTGGAVPLATTRFSLREWYGGVRVIAIASNAKVAIAMPAYADAFINYKLEASVGH
jgi:hypothetical protein